MRAARNIYKTSTHSCSIVHAGYIPMRLRAVEHVIEYLFGSFQNDKMFDVLFLKKLSYAVPF